MSWAVGYDERWKRWIGYGVPAYCDHPKCNKEIDRGLGCVCGYGEPYGGDRGCGLYFCDEHGGGFLCPRCRAYKPPYKRIKPDHPGWIHHMLTDESWAEWRAENPSEVEKMRADYPTTDLTEYTVTMRKRGKYVAISAECKRCHERVDVDVTDTGEFEFDEHDCGITTGGL